MLSTLRAIIMKEIKNVNVCAFYPCTGVFSVLNDKLVSCEVTRTIVSFDLVEGTSNVVSYVKYADKEEEVEVDGKTLVLYNSEYEFRTEVKRKMLNFSSIGALNKLGNVRGSGQNETCNYTGYAYRNGMAVEINPIKAETNAYTSGQKHTIIDGNLGTINEGEVYNRTEDVYAVNPYKVVLPDGTLIEREPTDKPFMPTKEQKDAAQAVLDALKKANELGVKLVYDSEDCDLSLVALNGGVEVMYRNDYEEEEYTNVTERVWKHMISGVGMVWFGCEDDFVVRKDKE